MPHIILRTKLLALKGDATSGSVFDLLTAADAVHEALENGEPTNATAMEVKLEEVENAVVDGEFSTGVLESFDAFTIELNDLI